MWKLVATIRGEESQNTWREKYGNGNLRMCIQALINPPKRVRQEIVEFFCSSTTPVSPLALLFLSLSPLARNLATQIK